MTIELSNTAAIVLAFVLGLGLREVFKFGNGLLCFAIEKVVFWSALFIARRRKREHRDAMIRASA